MRINSGEYERMRSWLAYVAPKILPAHQLTPATDPIAALDRLASDSPSKARSGLSMALGDAVEITSSWPEKAIAELDSELASKDLPTLSEVQTRFSNVVRRVIRRGRIKDDAEFYAVRNAIEIPDADTAALWPLLDAYEAQKR